MPPTKKRKSQQQQQQQHERKRLATAARSVQRTSQKYMRPDFTHLIDEFTEGEKDVKQLKFNRIELKAVKNVVSTHLLFSPTCSTIQEEQQRAVKSKLALSLKRVYDEDAEWRDAMLHAQMTMDMDTVAHFVNKENTCVRTFHAFLKFVQSHIRVGVPIFGGTPDRRSNKYILVVSHVSTERMPRGPLMNNIRVAHSAKHMYASMVPSNYFPFEQVTFHNHQYLGILFKRTYFVAPYIEFKINASECKEGITHVHYVSISPPNEQETQCARLLLLDHRRRHRHHLPCYVFMKLLWLTYPRYAMIMEWKGRNCCSWCV